MILTFKQKAILASKIHKIIYSPEERPEPRHRTGDVFDEGCPMEGCEDRWFSGFHKGYAKHWAKKHATPFHRENKIIALIEEL